MGLEISANSNCDHTSWGRNGTIAVVDERKKPDGFVYGIGTRRGMPLAWVDYTRSHWIRGWIFTLCYGNVQKLRGYCGNHSISQLFGRRFWNGSYNFLQEEGKRPDSICPILIGGVGGLYDATAGGRIMIRHKRMHKGSFTIEASIYIPILLFLIANVLSIGIHFFQEAKGRSENPEIKCLDIVKEFYNYQILEEIKEEIKEEIEGD